MTKKFLFLSLVLGLTLLVGGCQKSAVSATTASSSSLILFYSTDCPHCKKVEQYLAANKVTDRINIIMKEIHADKATAQLLIDKVNSENLNFILFINC